MTPEGPIRNGVGEFTSREIVANPEACATGDKFVNDTFEIFGAKVVG
jgi:hypothetical protein